MIDELERLWQAAAAATDYVQVARQNLFDAERKANDEWAVYFAAGGK